MKRRQTVARNGQIVVVAVTFLVVFVPWINATADCPELVSRLPHGIARAVAVSGHYAYVAGGSDGLRVIDISNPAELVQVGSNEDLGLIYSVAAYGGYVVVTDLQFGLIRVVDVSDPTTPTEVGSCSAWAPTRVLLSGDHAFVTDGGLSVIDLSTPETPFQIGFVSTFGTAVGLDLVDDHAYVTNYFEGLHVIDVSTPSAPVEVGSLETPGDANDVDVQDGFAYVADGISGLRVIDVSAPDAPVEVGFLAPPRPLQPLDVAVDGQFAYLGDSYDSLRVADVSDPSSPFEVGMWDQPGTGTGVTVAGDYVFLANSEAGIAVFRVCSHLFSDGFDSGDTAAWSPVAESAL